LLHCVGLHCSCFSPACLPSLVYQSIVPQQAIIDLFSILSRRINGKFNGKLGERILLLKTRCFCSLCLHACATYSTVALLLVLETPSAQPKLRSKLKHPYTLRTANTTNQPTAQQKQRQHQSKSPIIILGTLLRRPSIIITHHSRPSLIVLVVHSSIIDTTNNNTLP
jgi:hypothetical protein